MQRQNTSFVSSEVQVQPPWIIPQEEVMKMLGVSSRSTLWEWEKKNILTPLKGLTRRKVYLRSEVDELKADILGANGKHRFIQK